MQENKVGKNIMEALAIVNAKELIGKTIQWHAPAAKQNTDYTGIAKIVAVNENERNPLFVETIKGDELKYAFNEWGAGNKPKEPLCYSDGDRYITFEIVCYTIEDVVEKHWNDKSFVFCYSDKKEIFDKKLVGILEKEGVKNPFKNLTELRDFALDHKSKMCQ